MLMLYHCTAIPWLHGSMKSKTLPTNLSEIRYSSVVAPIHITTPSQWFVLGTTYLPCLRVPVTFELWFGTSSNISMQFLAIPCGLHPCVNGRNILVGIREC